MRQLHYTEEGGPDHNVAEQLIANPHGPDLGKYIQVIALANGTFTVQNSRNGVTKTYTK
jgi:hypothetical protein